MKAESQTKPHCAQVEERPGCIQAALKVLGDKWTPLLLGHLVEGNKTFSELSSELPGISPRTLSARLDGLEAAQIIGKTCYCEHPPRFKYGLTEKGKDLKSILTQMAEWGNKYSQKAKS